MDAGEFLVNNGYDILLIEHEFGIYQGSGNLI